MTTLQRIVSEARPGARVLRTWPLSGGVSAEMTGIEVASVSGETERLILRRPNARLLKHNPDAALDEARLLRRLEDRLPVPVVVYADQTCLLLEYIDGAAAYAPGLSNQRIVAMADQLAEIHQVSGPVSFLPSVQSVVEPLLSRRLQSGSTHLMDVGAEFDNARRQLSQREPVLLHGDFWPGNILWRDGELVGVVDWEEAMVGDPLLDLAIARLDLMCVYGKAAMETFTHRYLQRSGHELVDVGTWDLWAWLRFEPNITAWSNGYPELGRPDLNESAIRETLEEFLAQAIKALSAS